MAGRPSLVTRRVSRVLLVASLLVAGISAAGNATAGPSHLHQRAWAVAGTGLHVPGLSQWRVR
jgi:hypothetical protein